MNRASFFSALRSKSAAMFGTSLSARQVQGIEAILDAGTHLPLDHLAHVLGEVHHETGGGMYPIKETVFRSHKDQNPSDAEVIRRLDTAWSKGQLPWVKAPYWRKGYFGRGQIQLTHEANYRTFSGLLGVDLLRDPGKALDLAISARIAVLGCEKGLFTGRRLAEFDTPQGYDHRNARRIVNGYVAAQAESVEAAARGFARALSAAGYRPASQRPQERPSLPAAPTLPTNPFAALLAALLRLLRGGKG